MLSLKHTLGIRHDADEPHPSEEDLARFADGLCAGEERDRLVAHVASCASCYEILHYTLAVLEAEEPVEDRGTKSSRNRVQTWAIAASLIFCLVVGAAVYRMGMLPSVGPSIEQPIFTASVSMDNELRNVLSESDELTLTGDRADEIIRLLKEHGLTIGRPETIILADSYNPMVSKGLLAPRQTLKIRLEKGVLLLEVVKEKSE